LVRVASWRRQGLGRAGNTLAAGGGPRARRRSFGVGCPCLRLGSGEAWSSPSNGPIPDLIAPIRPLQLYVDGGYQLRIRSLKGTPNYGPRQLWIYFCIFFFISPLYLFVLFSFLPLCLLFSWQGEKVDLIVLSCFFPGTWQVTNTSVCHSWKQRAQTHAASNNTTSQEINTWYISKPNGKL
jgi:hypothetical protein